MEFTFNTQIVDISVALTALSAYRKGDYKGALNSLQLILDVEPKNWQARLMLGACYYKTGQLAAAQRAFRFLYDTCPDADTKLKAGEAMRACNAKLERKLDSPAEFGTYVNRVSNPLHVAWLD